MAGGDKNAATSTVRKGAQGEDVAADHLRRQGYRILKRNFSCRVGEIDIIAQDGEELVFVEVRSRHSKAAVDPIYSIDWRKQKKIARVACVYVQKRGLRLVPMRFDVIVVTMGPKPDVVHIPNAFDAPPGTGF